MSPGCFKRAEWGLGSQVWGPDSPLQVASPSGPATARLCVKGCACCLNQQPWDAACISQKRNLGLRFGDLCRSRGSYVGKLGKGLQLSTCREPYCLLGNPTGIFDGLSPRGTRRWLLRAVSDDGFLACLEFNPVTLKNISLNSIF